MQYRAYPRVTFRVEGLNPENEWVAVTGELPREGDHQRHRDEIAGMLRESGVKRYSKLRLVKEVTANEIIGNEIPV